MGLLRTTAIVGAAAFMPASVLAQQSLSPSDLQPRQAQEFQLPPIDELINPPRLEEFQREAELIGGQSAEILQQELEKHAADLGLPSPSEQDVSPGLREIPEPYRIIMLVSHSLGDEFFIQALRENIGRVDVSFAFRGVPEHMNVPEFALWLSKIQEAVGAQGASVTIDPEIFELTGIQSVPAMLLEDTSKDAQHGSEQGPILARAVGFHDTEWFYAQFASGETELSSTNTKAIIEEDLRARAAREASQVNERLGSSAEERIGRYWQGQRDTLSGMGITPASVDERRELFFNFVAERDITDAHGRVLAYQGEVISATDVAPFDRRMIVYDPEREEEVEFVEELLQKPEEGVTTTVLVASRLPNTIVGQEPWAGLQEQVTRFQRKVFLLNPAMQDSFKIRHTPTVVRPGRKADGRPTVFADEINLGG